MFHCVCSWSILVVGYLLVMFEDASSETLKSYSWAGPMHETRGLSHHANPLIQDGQLPQCLRWLSGE